MEVESWKVCRNDLRRCPCNQWKNESDPIPPRERDRRKSILCAHGAGIPLLMFPNLPTLGERTGHEVDHMPYVAGCWSFEVGKGEADGDLLNSSEDCGVNGVACDCSLWKIRLKLTRLSSCVGSQKCTELCAIGSEVFCKSLFTSHSSRQTSGTSLIKNTLLQ